MPGRGCCGREIVGRSPRAAAARRPRRPGPRRGAGSSPAGPSSPGRGRRSWRRRSSARRRGGAASSRAARNSSRSHGRRTPETRARGRASARVARFGAGSGVEAEGAAQARFLQRDADGRGEARTSRSAPSEGGVAVRHASQTKETSGRHRIRRGRYDRNGLRASFAGGRGRRFSVGASSAGAKRTAISSSRDRSSGARRVSRPRERRRRTGGFRQARRAEDERRGAWRTRGGGGDGATLGLSRPGAAARGSILARRRGERRGGCRRAVSGRADGGDQTGTIRSRSR